jgi:hypothetical protein
LLSARRILVSCLSVCHPFLEHWSASCLVLSSCGATNSSCWSTIGLSWEGNGCSVSWCKISYILCNTGGGRVPLQSSSQSRKPSSSYSSRAYLRWIPRWLSKSSTNCLR